MPPKQRNSAATTAPQTTSTSKASSASKSSSSSNASSQDASQILGNIYSKYVQQTPQRTKLLDAFMAFLVVVGVLQFVYCVIVGNFPFNAFLSGFSATVGQFVLTASLRMQTNQENYKEFEGTSPERAFADYVVGSLLLQFFCVNFIN